jgi:hypothetical protein
MTIEIGFDRKHGDDESVLVFLKTQEAGCAVVVDTLRGECAEFVQGVIERLEAAERELAWYRENTSGPCMGCGYYAKYPVCTKCGTPFPAQGGSHGQGESESAAMNVITLNANRKLYVLVLNADGAIKAVAAVNYHGGEVLDWAAYIGCGNAQEVAEHGEKAYKHWAVAMFSDLPRNLYRE